MTEEQIRTDEAMERVVQECLTVMTPMEADYIRECWLRTPRKTHAEFSVDWGLPPKSIIEFKAGTLASLKRILAEKNIRSMGDVLVVTPLAAVRTQELIANLPEKTRRLA